MVRRSQEMPGTVDVFLAIFRNVFMQSMVVLICLRSHLVDIALFSVAKQESGASRLRLFVFDLFSVVPLADVSPDGAAFCRAVIGFLPEPVRDEYRTFLQRLPVGPPASDRPAAATAALPPSASSATVSPPLVSAAAAAATAAAAAAAAAAPTTPMSARVERPRGGSGLPLAPLPRSQLPDDGERPDRDTPRKRPGEPVMSAVRRPAPAAAREAVAVAGAGDGVLLSQVHELHRRLDALQRSLDALVTVWFGRRTATPPSSDSESESLGRRGGVEAVRAAMQTFLQHGEYESSENQSDRVTKQELWPAFERWRASHGMEVTISEKNFVAAFSLVHNHFLKNCSRGRCGFAYLKRRQ
jgi:hypothetical protein